MAAENIEENGKSNTFLRVVLIFLVAMALTGLVSFASQYNSSNRRVQQQAQERAEKIAEEVTEAVEEYPAYPWLLNYWHDHAYDLDIEYDADYGEGTRTEKKCRKLAKRHPELQIRYATTKEIEKLPPEDQKLYAEITYSWLITHLDQIKKTYKMRFMYGALASDPYDRQFFLFSAGEKGCKRGTTFNEVYTLGVDQEVAQVQQNAMRLAAGGEPYFAMEGSNVDYYSLLTETDDGVLLVGLTYNLDWLVDAVNKETISGTVTSMMYELLLAFFSLAAVWFYVLQPLIERNQRNTKEKERMATELRLAKEIQASMLPHTFPPFPDRKEIDMYASMDPAREVGGDFYDFFLIDEDHLGVVMADVSGKGIPAALFMMESKIIIENNAKPGRSPSEILSMTNEVICANNTMEMFVSVWLGIIQLSTGKLTAANAGHEYPVLCAPGGVFEILKDKHGLVIGGMEGVRYREYELMIAPGTKLFLYTDGVPEATDAKDELFGMDRTVEALNQDPAAAPEELLHNVRASVDAFVGEAEQFDDLTMLCLEYRGAEK